MKNVQNKKNSALSMPLIALKEVIIFPGTITSLFIGRGKSLNAINEVVKDSNMLLVTAQTNSEIENPTTKDLYKVGTLVEILQFLKLPDDTIKVLIKGVSRVNLENIEDKKDYLSASYSVLEEKLDYDNTSLEDLKDVMLDLFNKYTASNKKIPQSIVTSLHKINDIVAVVDNIATHLPIKTKDKQQILEKSDLIQRIAFINSLLEIELDLINVEKKLREQVKKQMEKNQKDYYLNEQLKAIQKELNTSEDGKDEIEILRDKTKSLKINKDAKDKLLSEIKKLSSMSPISAEASVVRNYVEMILSLPWDKKTKISIDLEKAEKYLDSEHYGLNKVKERIIEYLAVLLKSKNLRAPILCFVGPPGVGKTSLAKSIAQASGREFVRISLGGLRDEAEIRGHRRTYIGAMPGKIIQAIRKAKVNNPLILLDEIDKMSSDFRGDPASALLEVLDPEQNSNFVDHYVELEYDLSNVMFITTSNSYNMHEALLDRMEMIEINGYTEEEKVQIAKQHLLEKNMKMTALGKNEFSVNDEVILSLVRNYTRESGVRQLDREMANLTRKAVKQIMVEKAKKVEITKANLIKYAGVPKFKTDSIETENRVGIVNGLAWTRVGGDTLYVEAVKTPGKGEIKITGKLGDVMKESIQAAYSLIYSNLSSLGLSADVFKKNDIHIHVPEGATPKDGPSAGITMVTAIFSLLSGTKVKHDVAMTGEITLRGKVLAIGGLKEKLLAALRAGIKTVIIPKDNEKDLIDLPPVIIENLKIVIVSDIYEVLDVALEKKVFKNRKMLKNSLT
ncbi:endopeptidase La [Rickettsiales bacterium LUAb2]